VNTPIEVFSTCPNSSGAATESYLKDVANVARWSEQNGCRGILVYADNSLVDPWLVSQIIIENTAALCPLVAVQPAYMHPYTVAKLVASFGFLYGRQIYLNVVAGGFKNDLLQLNDTTPHDKRYERLTEYTKIIGQLLASSAPLTFSGDFYNVDKLRLTPALPPHLFPGIFVSGSSEAGIASARQALRQFATPNRQGTMRRNLHRMVFLRASGSALSPASPARRRGGLPISAFPRIARGN
jgi:alkanesulfonate monooxygenase